MDVSYQKENCRHCDVILKTPSISKLKTKFLKQCLKCYEREKLNQSINSEAHSAKLSETLSKSSNSSIISKTPLKVPFSIFLFMIVPFSIMNVTFSITNIMMLTSAFHVNSCEARNIRLQSLINQEFIKIGNSINFFNSINCAERFDG